MLVQSKNSPSTSKKKFSHREDATVFRSESSPSPLSRLRPAAQLRQGPGSEELCLQAARPPTARPEHQEHVRYLPGSEQEPQHCLSCEGRLPKAALAGAGREPPSLVPRPGEGQARSKVRAKAAAGFCPGLHRPHCLSIPTAKRFPGHICACIRNTLRRRSLS